MRTLKTFLKAALPAMALLIMASASTSAQWAPSYYSWDSSYLPYAAHAWVYNNAQQTVFLGGNYPMTITLGGYTESPGPYNVVVQGGPHNGTWSGYFSNRAINNSTLFIRPYGSSATGVPLEFIAEQGTTCIVTITGPAYGKIKAIDTRIEYNWFERVW